MERSYETLLELLQGRRSVRKLRPDPIPDALLVKLVEAARWAPSAGNRQAFRFLILRDRDRIQALADAVRARIAALREQLRPEARTRASAYLENFAHFGAAPVLIAPIFRRGPDLLHAALLPGTEPGPRSADRGSLGSVSAATMCLLLAAHALGLGACWMTGPLIAEPALSEALEVPQGWSLGALIPVGIPAEHPDPPPRRTAEQLTRWLDPT